MELLYAEKSGHRNNFDFLRFTLATLVVFTHSYVVHSGVIDNEPLWRITNKQLGFGTLALNCFFLISGFLVTQSWNHSSSFFDFLKKRVLRIYPGFIVVCFMCAFVFAPLGLGIIRPIRYIVDYWSYIDVGYLTYTSLKLGGIDGLLLPETFKTLPCANDVNTSIWTIPYEFVCYLSVPVIALLRHRLIPLILFILVFASNIYHYKAYQYYNMEGIIQPWYFPRFLYHRIGEDWQDPILNFEHFFGFFMAGVCFYTYRQHIPRSIYLAVLSLVVMLAAAFWIRVFELAQLIFGAYLVFYFVFSKRIKIHHFAKYGDFSYGVYLYGWPIQQLVLLYIGSQIGVLGVFLIAMVFTLMAAYVSWHFVERPFLSLKKKKLKLVGAPTV